MVPKKYDPATAQSCDLIAKPVEPLHLFARTIVPQARNMRFNAMLSPLKNSAIWSAIILVAWEIDRLQDRLIGSMAHGFLATLP